METPKSLNEVLPAEYRKVATLKPADVIGKVCTLHGVSFASAGEVEYAAVTLSVDSSTSHKHVTFNQAQIVKALHFLEENKLYPVCVTFIADGKSYAMVDPSELPQPVTPTEKAE